MLLQQKQKSKQAVQKLTAQQTPAEAVGADNAGHAVMLKPQTRKRQAESNSPAAEAALDTQADQMQQPLIDSRAQAGEEEQDGELTLEQRVNALNLHQRPASAMPMSLHATRSSHSSSVPPRFQQVYLI